MRVLVACVLVVGCSQCDSPEPPVTPHAAEPEQHTELVAEVDQPAQPPVPPSEPAEAAFDVAADLRPVETDDEEGGVELSNDDFTVMIGWPRFEHPTPEINDALEAAIRPMAGQGVLEEGHGEESGGCGVPLSRAGLVSVVCYTYKSVQSDEEFAEQIGGAASGCDVTPLGETWRIVGTEIRELDVRSAFRADAEERLRAACRAEVEEFGYDTPEGLCSRNPLELVVGERGIVVLPAFGCEEAAEGVLLPFAQVEALYEPTSVLLPVLRRLKAENEGLYEDEDDEAP